MDRREKVLDVVIADLVAVANEALGEALGGQLSQAAWEAIAAHIAHELRVRLGGSYAFLDALGADDLHDGRGRVNKPAILKAMEELCGLQATPITIAKYKHATEFLRRTFGL